MPTPLHLQLRALRKRQGINQVEFARRLSVASQTISRIEAGTRDPSAHLLIRWMEACGLELDLLSQGREPMPDGIPPHALYLARRFLELAPSLEAHQLETLTALLDLWEKQVKKM